MDIFPEPDGNTVTSSITAVRRAWLDAVRAGDVERLAAMVTTDVVVVHGNGRCVRGRDELKADFLKGFEAFSIEQNVSSVEVVVRGRWAFEISEVESWLTPRLGGESTHVHSTTIVALNRRPDGSMESRTCTWDARFIDDDFEVSCSNAVTLEVSTPPRSALLNVFSSTCNPRNNKPHIPVVSQPQVEVEVFPCGELCVDVD